MLVELGHVTGDYWMGLETMFNLTQQGDYKLHIDMQAVNGTWYWEEYDTVIIGDNEANYTIHLTGQYVGNTATTTGTMYYQNSMMFSAMDRDLDNWRDGSCSVRTAGAWWHDDCFQAGLNASPSRYFCIYNPDVAPYWVYLQSSRMVLVCK